MAYKLCRRFIQGIHIRNFPQNNGDIGDLAGIKRFKSSGWCSEAVKGYKSGILGLCALVPADLLRLCDYAINSSKHILNEIIKTDLSTKYRAERVLYAMDGVSNTLCSVADPSELLRHVHPDKEWRLAANETVERISEFISRVNVDEKLFFVMQESYSAEKSGLDREESLVFLHMIESIRHQGLGLPPEKRDEYLNLQKEEAITAFAISDENVLRHRGVTTAGGTEIPPNPAIFSHLLRTSADEDLRRRLWKAQCSSDANTLKKLLRLREVRARLAKIRGFSSFAECAQRECIMKTPETVEAFLHKSSSSIEKKLMEELNELRELKVKHCKSHAPLLPWDIDFLITKEKGEFKAEVTLTSLISLFESLLWRLFGIKLVQDTSETLWDPFVVKFALVEKVESFDGHSTRKSNKFPKSTEPNENVLAYLYLDLFERPYKANVCAQFTVRCSKLIGDTSNDINRKVEQIWDRDAFLTVGGIVKQLPTTAIVCSFPSPRGKGIGTVSEAFRRVKIDVVAAQTLFHELGHTLHALLSETKLQHLSGNRGGVDFAEFSSHLFELYFAFGLKELAKIEGSSQEFVKSANIQLQKFRAIETARMALAAFLDQRFYGVAELNGLEKISMEASKSFGFSHENFDEAGVLKSIPLFSSKLDSGMTVAELLGVPALTNFDHLVHYGGTYYCYLYSRALAGQVWSSFGGLNDRRETGERLRNFFRNGSIDASITPISDLAGYDISNIPYEVLVDF